MDEGIVNISFTYDLGGTNNYVIALKRGDEVYHYKFLASSEKDVLNFVAKQYDSKAYITRERGTVRIILLSDPSILIYFVK